MSKEIRTPPMTLRYNNEWYNDLAKSSLTPPPWVFSVVWPVLYIMMILSVVIFISSSYSSQRHNPLIPVALLCFLIQLVFNLAWSPTFFKYHKICGSILLLVGLLVFLSLSIVLFYKTSPTASYMLMPYFIWSCFALYLNIQTCRLNRDRP